MINKNDSTQRLQNITTHQNKAQIIYRRTDSFYGSRNNSRSRLNYFEQSNISEQKSQFKNQSIYGRKKQPNFFKSGSSESGNKEDIIKLMQDTINQQNKEIKQLKMINLYLQQSINHRDTVIKKDRIQRTKMENTFIKQDKDQKNQYDRTENIIINNPEVLSPKEKSDTIKLNKSNMKILVAIQNQMFQDNHTQVENEVLNLESIIDLKISDTEALNLYDNDINIKFVRNIIQQEDKFIKLVEQSNQHRLGVIYDKFRKLVHDHHKMFTIILKLKNLLRATIDISETNLLDETLDKIQANTNICVDSDKCSCFIVDQHKKELWARSAEGVDQIIRVPLTKGIVGTVATTNEVINIKNAPDDQRLNPDIDKRNNYFTKTIITVPVCNKTETLAVIQCINKKNGFFNKDDEAILNIISQFTKIILQRQLDSDQSYVIHGKLRLMLKNFIKLQINQSKTLEEFLIQAEQMLRQIIQTEKVRISVRKDKQTIYYNENGILQSVNIMSGIMNLSINKKTQINIMNSSQHLEFSTLIDLDTNLPTITKPFYGDKCMGALQVINIKGLQSGSKDFPYISQIDDELLGYFTDQITLSLDKIFFINIKE